MLTNSPGSFLKHAGFSICFCTNEAQKTYNGTSFGEIIAVYDVRLSGNKIKIMNLILITS